jgi:ribosomal protein S18 acetylase RimI-like enzyme
MGDVAVVVRRLGASEWPLLRAVRLRALADAPDAFGSTFDAEAGRSDEWWAASASNLAWFVATAGAGGDDQVGLVAGLPPGEEPDSRSVISMWVAATHRGRGVAVALLDAVERWARADGATALCLRVSDRNARAQRFYARQGFAPTGEREPLHSDPTANALGMRRDLRPARLRFAPTSSVELHAGHARNAVLTWVLARQLSGAYFVRFEDTDLAKAAGGTRDEVLEDLDWLGLAGTGPPAVQCELADAHRSALEVLTSAGLTYRDGAAIRFALPADGSEDWDDVILGRISVRNDQLQDPVLLRSSGAPTFVLASTVDDIVDAVTHLVRVDGMLRVTAVQRHIWRALDAVPPVTAHAAALVARGGGAPLRAGRTDATIRALRDRGVRPEAVLLYLAMPQTASWKRPPAGLGEIIDQIDLRRLPHHPYTFDVGALDRLNRRVEH